MGSLFLPFSAGAASPSALLNLKAFLPQRFQHRKRSAKKRSSRKTFKIAGTALMCAGTYSMGEGSSEHSLFSDYGWDVSPFRAASDDTDVHFAVAVSKRPTAGRIQLFLLFEAARPRRIGRPISGRPWSPLTRKTKTADPKTVPSVHEGFERYAATVLRTPMDLDGDGKEEMVAPLSQTASRPQALPHRSQSGRRGCKALLRNVLWKRAFLKLRSRSLLLVRLLLAIKLLPMSMGSELT